MKSAPMQLIYSYFKQSNNVNISFILFILFCILFHLYLVILYMFTSPEGICAKPKFRLGATGRRARQGYTRAVASPATTLEPPMYNVCFSFLCYNFFPARATPGEFCVCIYLHISYWKNADLLWCEFFPGCGIHLPDYEMTHQFMASHWAVDGVFCVTAALKQDLHAHSNEPNRLDALTRSWFSQSL